MNKKDSIFLFKNQNNGWNLWLLLLYVHLSFKGVFFFISKRIWFFKRLLFFFFFQCSLHEKFSIAEIKKDNSQSLSKNFMMVESKNWEVCPPGNLRNTMSKKNRNQLLTMKALRSKIDNCLLFCSLQHPAHPRPLCPLFLRTRACGRTHFCVYENNLLDCYNHWAIMVLRAKLLILWLRIFIVLFLFLVLALRNEWSPQYFWRELLCFWGRTCVHCWQ